MGDCESSSLQRFTLLLILYSAIFVCPSYALMLGFKGPSFRVSTRCNQASCNIFLWLYPFRENTPFPQPLMALMSVYTSSLMRAFIYEFHTLAHELKHLSYSSYRAATPIDASFAGTFPSFVKALSPNHNALNMSVTPFWSTYAPDNTEMRFNVTEAGAANIRTFQTDSDLLERCAFWRSISEFTPQ